VGLVMVAAWVDATTASTTCCRVAKKKDTVVQELIDVIAQMWAEPLSSLPVCICSPTPHL
jgi:hypothetical protein